MSRENTRRARDLFLDALDLPTEQRGAFLDRGCAGDAELRGDVESLLASHTAAGEDYLEPAGRRSESRAGGGPERWIGRRIGAYAIDEVLGSGGMGVVYLARQDQPRRRVALKLVRAAWDTQLRRRLAYEGEWLGRLHHPCVAQIYEAGTVETDEGEVTFLAMEYVEGRDLDVYVREQKLGVRPILELFARLCDGVHHAHQNRIIHRDLKPSNVLVTPDGEPKVLDFGIARPAEDDETRTLETAAGEMLGTLPFMSPEQLLGRPFDTRTDVYSLGVLLYLLLAERLPMEVSGLALPTAMRRICEEEPPRLGRVAPQLSGDVETIVAKALEKDVERRYASAADLAADLRRFLNHEPIAARPASTAYQLARFARRNRGLVAAIGAAFVVLIGGLIGTSYGMWRARVAQAAEAELRVEEQHQRERADLARADAEREKAIAVSVRELVERLLTAPNPFQNPEFDGSEVRVVDVLANYDVLVGETLAGQPEVEFEVSGFLGATYASLGLDDEARAAFQRQREIGARLFDAGSDPLRGVDWQLAKLDAQAFRFEDARARYEALLGSPGGSSETSLSLRRDRAIVLGMLGEVEEAVGELEEVLAAQLAANADDASVQRTRRDLGRLLLQAGRPLEAEPHLREAAARLDEQFGPRHPDTLMARGDLAFTLFELRRLDEAEVLMREELAILDELVAPEHPRRAHALSQLAAVMSGNGRYAEAKEVLVEVLELQTEVHGEDDLRTLDTAFALATNHHFLGELEEARELYTLAAEGFSAALGVGHVQVLDVRLNLATLAIERGELDQSAEQLRDIIATFEERDQGAHPVAIDARRQLAVVLDRKGVYDESAELFLRSFTDLRASYGLASPRTLELLELVVESLESAGEDEEALRIAEDVVGELEDDDPRAFTLAGGVLADLLERRGETVEARAWRARLADQ